MIATSHCLGEPKSGLPLPPAIYRTAVGYNERPIVKITVPVTIGGNNLRSRFKKIPKIIAVKPPIICAPKITRITLYPPAWAIS